MRFKLLLAASALVLANCTHVDKISQSPDPAFGDSVKYNALAQTIDPDPVYPEDAAQPGDSGVTGANAIQRLRKDQTNARHRTEVESGKSGSLTTTQGTGSGPK